MPRISDEILDCVVYLYQSPDAAKEGVSAGGSGFLVTVPSISDSNKTFTFVVTNRHVIKRAGALVIRINSTHGSVYIVESLITNWHFHPDGDDVAVAFVGSIDREQSRISYLRTLDAQMFITKQTIQEFDIGIGDDAFIVGRFINHEGKQKNMPAVQFGHIGIMPLEPIRSEDGHLQESFAVDIRSAGGFSGSPVFVRLVNYDPGRKSSVFNLNNPYPHKGANSGTNGIISLSYRIFLLGVNWGHIPITYDVEEKAKDVSDKPKSTNLFIKANTHMAAVVPTWKLAELIQLTERTLSEFPIPMDSIDRYIINIEKAEEIKDIKGDTLSSGDFSVLP